jgi:hypothetical protein
MRHHRITRSTALGLALAALAAPTAAAQQQDLRSPDTRDAARAAATAARYHDLRSQDALDAARSLPPDQLVAVSEELRSEAAPEPTTVRVSESDRFDWPSAVIGAASLLGLIGVSLAVLLGVRQITRRPAQA